MERRTSLLCGLVLLVLPLEGPCPPTHSNGPALRRPATVLAGALRSTGSTTAASRCGYPLTDELIEQGRTVRYFERQRFELHSENAPPYDVLLGLLGEEVLLQQGIDWHTQPLSRGPVASCLWFQQTQHNVCDQTPSSGFKRYWQTHGLEFDGQAGKSYPESLALFGLPVTEPFQETINGETFQVQWFERARFEWHPGNVDPYRVLLGRLGAEVRPAPAPTPSIPSYASQDSPAEVLASFYNAINRQEYQRAYSYWETPPSSYPEFAQGYADTAKGIHYCREVILTAKGRTSPLPPLLPSLLPRHAKRPYLN